MLSGRKCFMVLSLLVVLSVLIGCAAPAPTPAPTPASAIQPAAAAPTAAKPADMPYKGTKLVLWQTIAASDFWGDEADAVLKDFTDKTGITVDWVNFGPEWTNKAATAFTSKSSDFDLIFTWATPTAEWARSGWLEELDSRWTPQMTADKVEQPMQSVMYMGKNYGVPQFLSCQTGYYNAKLFKEAGLDPNKPPETFEQFIEYAQKMTKKPDQYGFSVSWGAYGNLFQTFAQWVQLAGGDILDDKGNVAFNTAAGKKALQAMKDGIQQGWTDPGSLSYTDTFIALQPFQAGKVGMEFHWPSVWARVQDSKQSQVIDDVKLFLVPGFQGGRKSACLDGSMGWSMNKYSKNKDAAWEFMKWAYSLPVQKKMYQKTAWLPVVQSAFTDPEIKDTPLIKHYAEQVKYPGKRYGSAFYNEMSKEMAVPLTDAINGKITVDEGLDKAFKAAQDVAAKFK